MKNGDNTKRLRVVSYVRVGVPDANAVSVDLQSENVQKYIDKHPDWELVGTYKDECSGGADIKCRQAFQRMIEDCKAGKIDIIVTKSMSRLVRNLPKCISIINMLKHLDPPVGVLFTGEDFCTLDPQADQFLNILCQVVEEESRTKAIP